MKNNSLLNDQVPEWRGKLQGQSGTDATENEVRLIALTRHTISHIQDAFRMCFPPTARNITFRNFISQQKHVYKNEGNYLDPINLNAHISLFLFASVYEPHNLSQ